MLKIGDFSSLAQISVKTLRYYDESGLLKPVTVDSATGYRFYSAAQLSQLHRILALKDLGFSLDQIREILNKGVTAEQMRGMLLLRQAEQEKRVQDESDRLSRITSRIRLIEQENIMSYEVVTKSVGPQWIASIRETIAAYPAVGALYPRVMAALGPAMASATVGVALWHDPEYKESNVDAEAGMYLKQPVATNNDVQVHELPAVNVASTIHNGAYNRLQEAYDSLLRWVADNGYHVAGPIRELYLRCGQPGKQDDESCVTEIQVPIAKS
jgi:DNA-binding transcriptional MerR regulator